MVKVVSIAIKKNYVGISAIETSTKTKSCYKPFRILDTLATVHELVR